LQPTLAYGQFLSRFGDVAGNLATLGRLAARGAEAGADLMVFPELGLTGYDFKDAEEARGLAEPFGDGPTSRALLGLEGRH